LQGGAENPLAEQASDAILGANPFVGIDPQQVVGDLARSIGALATRPRRVVSEVARIGRELGGIIAGDSSLASTNGDKRFSDVAWTENPVYRRFGQGYVALVAGAHRMVDDAGLDALETQRAHFAVGLLADALAPTNGLLTNPAALKRAFDTAGASLFRGARNLVHDVRENGGMPSTVDARPFAVGQSLAKSPGSVVYRDEVFELIQYRPSTETVHERPVVVIPPQINKFYVLDLAPGRSFTEFAVASGLPYFAISWRNPTAAQREWGLDRYVRACVDAIDVACAITGADAAGIVGLCAGGVTMAKVLETAPRKVASATFAVSMLDLKAPSIVGMLASDAVVAMALRRSRSRGVLDGAEMARVFAWMRPNDLVWNYWVNNYLMGNDPPAFDILFWNADHTRLPAELHADFLDMYVRNPLPSSAHLKRFSAPTYVVAGMTDHIVPWKAAYRTTQMVGGRPEFVLSSSGHIQSIVNPPGNPKASYFAAPAGSSDPDEWLAGAASARGSWWEHWARWTASHSGARRPAPKTLGGRKYRSRGKAPGKYVLER
jgi:poly[(R)-3-hydroxyalkanoate] polymerase subunit PhaC